MSGATSRLASVRKLFSGAAMPQAREDDDHGGDEEEAGATAGPSQAQVEKLVSDERAAAAKEATEAANARWNAAMTSDVGRARPKAAAHLLSTTTMSAADVQAALTAFDDDKPAGAAAGGEQAVKSQQQQDRERLAADEASRPDTGGAASKPGARSGEGEDANAAALDARREARAKRRNAGGGKRVNQE